MQETILPRKKFSDIVVGTVKPGERLKLLRNFHEKLTYILIRTLFSNTFFKDLMQLS